MCGMGDPALLGQLIRDDVFDRLGGDPQATSDILSGAADQRPEYELLEAEGVGGVLPLERRDEVLTMVTPRTAMEGGLVEPEAGLTPDVEVADGLGSRLELDVGVILLPAAFATAAFGQRPADLEAVSVLMAVIPGDLHAGGQVDLDRNVGHGSCPAGARGSTRRPSLATSCGSDRHDTPEKAVDSNAQKTLGLAL